MVRGSLNGTYRLITLLFSFCQNVNFVDNQKKFWELIDAWHKDCQQASFGNLEDNKVTGAISEKVCCL